MAQKPRLWIGIDPGYSGGVAAFGSGHESVPAEGLAFKMPEEECDLAKLLKELVGFMHPSQVCLVLEKVHSMPKQGVTSVFTFGQQFGICRGVIAALELPRVLVTPQQWQKALGCQTGGDKKVTLSVAKNQWPWLKPTHATADAILIAHYARKFISP
jgi:crossover junction endodeoxyribonuclease RuvC